MRKIDIWSAGFGWRVVHSAHSSGSKVQAPPYLADCLCAKKLPQRLQSLVVHLQYDDDYLVLHYYFKVSSNLDIY